MPNEVLYRALVRVVVVHVDTVEVVVPRWNAKNAIQIPLTKIPAKLRPLLEPGLRFFARANTGTSRLEQLYFVDFEWENLSENSKFACALDAAFLTPRT